MLTSDSWDCDAMLGGNAMRYAIIVLALLGVLASPRPAAAGSAKFISELCQSKADYRQFACTSYIIGVILGLELMMLLQKKRTICIPRYFRKSMDQQVTLVKEYMRDNPSKDNEDAELIVFAALAKAFVDNH